MSLFGGNCKDGNPEASAVVESRESGLGSSFSVLKHPQLGESTVLIVCLSSCDTATSQVTRIVTKTLSATYEILETR
jgi:CHAT domain-containing protein